MYGGGNYILKVTVIILEVSFEIVPFWVCWQFAAPNIYVIVEDSDVSKEGDKLVDNYLISDNLFSWYWKTSYRIQLMYDYM